MKKTIIFVFLLSFLISNFSFAANVRADKKDYTIELEPNIETTSSFEKPVEKSFSEKLLGGFSGIFKMTENGISYLDGSLKKKVPIYEKFRSLSSWIQVAVVVASVVGAGVASGYIPVKIPVIPNNADLANFGDQNQLDHGIDGYGGEDPGATPFCGFGFMESRVVSYREYHRSNTPLSQQEEKERIMAQIEEGDHHQLIDLLPSLSRMIIIRYNNRRYRNIVDIPANFLTNAWFTRAIILINDFDANNLIDIIDFVMRLDAVIGRHQDFQEFFEALLTRVKELLGNFTNDQLLRVFYALITSPGPFGTYSQIVDIEKIFELTTNNQEVLAFFDVWFREASVRLKTFNAKELYYVIAALNKFREFRIIIDYEDFQRFLDVWITRAIGQIGDFEGENFMSILLLRHFAIGRGVAADHPRSPEFIRAWFREAQARLETLDVNALRNLLINIRDIAVDHQYFQEFLDTWFQEALARREIFDDLEELTIITINLGRLGAMATNHPGFQRFLDAWFQTVIRSIADFNDRQFARTMGDIGILGRLGMVIEHRDLPNLLNAWFQGAQIGNFNIGALVDTMYGFGRLGAIAADPDRRDFQEVLNAWFTSFIEEMGRGFTDPDDYGPARTIHGFGGLGAVVITHPDFLRLLDTLLRMADVDVQSGVLNGNDLDLMAQGLINLIETTLITDHDILIIMLELIERAGRFREAERLKLHLESHGIYLFDEETRSNREDILRGDDSSIPGIEQEEFLENLESQNTNLRWLQNRRDKWKSPDDDE